MAKRLLCRFIWLPAVAAVGCATTTTPPPEASSVGDGTSRWYTAAKPAAPTNPPRSAH